MGKLELIKTKLAKMLLQFATIKTDKAVLEYDGDELVVDTEVYVSDENGERHPAEDGEYVTEDNKVITITDGKVTSIVEKEEEPVAEDPTEGVEAEDAPVEETPTEDPEKEVEDEINKRLTALEAKVEELVALIEKMVEKSENDNTAVEERLSKIEKMSAAKPIEEVVEIQKTARKTGDAKLDRFLERYGNA